MLFLLALSFLVDLAYGDLDTSNIQVFTIPFLIGLILYVLQFALLGGT